MNMFQPFSKSKETLLGAAIGLAKTAYGKPKEYTTVCTLQQALSTFARCENQAEIAACTKQVIDEKYRLSPSCAYCMSPCGATSDYDVSEIQLADPDVRAAKYWILYALLGIAAENSVDNNTFSTSYAEFFIGAVDILGEDLSASEIWTFADSLLSRML